MRLRIAHTTVHRYDPPATGVIQVLRLTPRNHDGQYVIRWRIDVSSDVRLAAHEDAFGNLTHVFSADGPFDELRVEVDGEAETQNTDGVVRGAAERFPPTLFLRDTAAHAGRHRDAGLGAGHSRRRRRRRARRPARAARPLARGHRPRSRAGDDHGHGGIYAPARLEPGSGPHLHRRDPLPRHSGALRLRLSVPRRRTRARRPMPGRKPTFPTSAGSASTPSSAPARPTPMCASPSASMPKAPPRSAVQDTATATRAWRLPSRSINSVGRRPTAPLAAAAIAARRRLPI